MIMNTDKVNEALPGIGFKLDSNNDYDMQNKKLVNVKQGTGENDVVIKSYLDSEIAQIPSVDKSQSVLKAGDTTTGPLIIPKDSYPVQEDLNKVINYETIREIFLSRKEAFPMETSINMNNNLIQNVTTPTSNDHATNKGYCDLNF